MSLGIVLAVLATPPAPAPAAEGLPSMLDLIVSGGPLMWPIGLCSVVALAYAVERWLRLSSARLGTPQFGRTLVTAVETGGPQQGLELCAKEETPLARIMAAALRKARAARGEREKHVEDVASAEVRRLTGNLKPLLIVYLVAPLLGLLGTVWGLIECFATIATEEGLGKPELLASGVYQALVTTAAGLAVAIPTVVAYYWLKARVDRFARRTEELYTTIDDRLATQEVPVAHP